MQNHQHWMLAIAAAMIGACDLRLTLLLMFRRVFCGNQSLLAWISPHCPVIALPGKSYGLTPLLLFRQSCNFFSVPDKKTGFSVGNRATRKPGQFW